MTVSQRCPHQPLGLYNRLASTPHQGRRWSCFDGVAASACAGAAFLLVDAARCQSASERHHAGLPLPSSLEALLILQDQLLRVMMRLAYNLSGMSRLAC